MGRGCTMDEWVHFEKLPAEGRVPNSSYWYVLCRHCMRGYEQKQLFNPPSKLTGRRSAMRAHLKICPMYATQYKMEQSAAAAAAAAATASASASVSATPAEGSAEAAAMAAVAATATPGEAKKTSGEVGEKRKRRSADGETSGPRTCLYLSLCACLAGVCEGTHGFSLSCRAGGGRGKHCMMEEWEHFTRLQDEGYIGKSNFFYAICRHCQRAYDEAPADKKPLMEPERMVGRREKMRKHLAMCPHFKGELPPLERRLPLRPGLGAFLPGGFTGIPATGAPILEARTPGIDGANGDAAVPATAPSGPAAAAVAAAVMAATATTTTTPSSRLALDEWHYFTRLHRKKDSAYYYARCNFCQAAYENAPEAMRASLEPTVVMGRKSNMQTHLSKCIHVPKELLSVQRGVTAAAAGYNAASLAAAAAAAAEAGDAAGAEAFSSLAKRIKLDAASASFASSGMSLDSSPSVLPDVKTLRRALLEFQIQNHLPFNWIDSASAKKLFGLFVRPTDVVDALIPNATDLRTKVLDELYSNEVSRELDSLRKETIPANVFAAPQPSGTDATPVAWPVSLVCSLVVGNDHAAGVEVGTVPRVQCLVTNGKVRVPLTSTPASSTASDASTLGEALDITSDEQQLQEEGGSVEGATAGELGVSAELKYYHGLDLARVLDERLRLSSEREKLSPAIVIVPCNPVAERTVGILRLRWPRVTFVTAFEDLLGFALTKTLATPEVFATVSSLVDLWQQHQLTPTGAFLKSVVSEPNPFKGWRECTSFMQLLLDPSTFTDKEDIKNVVASALDRESLQRVHAVLQAFSVAFGAFETTGFLSLANTLAQLGAIFRAATGFEVVQRALEAVWAHLEQPLFLLAHALDPHLRMDGVSSTDLTKLSTLSDLGVAYFTSFAGRKASSLRGEVTAYLHTSQPHFSRALVAEFPVIENYYLYLSDDYPALSVLMRLLHSFSSVSGSSTATTSGPLDRAKERQQMYSADEHVKLAYLKDAWHISETVSAAPTEVVSTVEGSEDAAVSISSSLTGSAVIDHWKEALEKQLASRGVDFTQLDSEFESPRTTPVDAAAAMLVVDVITSEINRQEKLPLVPADSEALFPSTPLGGASAKKVTLKELFGAASVATI